MVTAAVGAATLACMATSLLISYIIGGRLERLWAKLAVFMIASVIGVLLFPLLGGLYAGARPQQEYLIYPAFRSHVGEAIIGVLIMAYFGIWRLQRKVDEKIRK